ncbi:hypothetical protein [Vibrio furnissii]|uniref:hypothetical protein n=1 Tax=Vibrio furnissii TaxID=29494 RepID=UPI001180C687|nr:hypothetical protein [Vibrio furnissii]TRN26570.1 hypothetical protein DM784_04630 [Vibrio furnissii]
MNNIVKLTSIAISISLLGCSNTEKFNISSTNNEFGVVVLEADKRVILMRNDKVCAEPPPETQTTKNDSLNILANAVLSKDKEISAQATRAYSIGVQQLYVRSHTNQLYRDASYALCQGYLSGALTNKSLMTQILNFKQSALRWVDISIIQFEKMKLEFDVSKQSDLIKILDEKISVLKAERTTIQSETNRLVSSLEDNTKPIEANAYLDAQNYYTNLAFTTLILEFNKFYDASAQLDKGKVQAYENSVTQMKTDLKILETKLTGLENTSQSIKNDTEVVIEKSNTIIETQENHTETLDKLKAVDN